MCVNLNFRAPYDSKLILLICKYFNLLRFSTHLGLTEMLGGI